MMHKVNEEEFEVLFSPKQKTKSRGASLAHSHTFKFHPLVVHVLSIACVSVGVCRWVCGSFFPRQYICMLHYDPHPSLSVSFPP